MKKLFTLSVFFFLLSFAAFSQNTIATDSVFQTGPCAGSQVIVRFSTTGSFPFFGNTFTAQLSNAWGQFNNPVNIGTTNFNLGIMMATLPNNATFGFLYRIRVISSNPAVVGTPSPNTVIITSNPFTSTIVAPQGATICPGESKTLQVAVQANNYLWSTGATTQAITVTQPGTYWVKVTDVTTCESRDTLEVTAGASCSPLSTTDNLQSGAITLFPNPVSASGILTLNGLEGDWREVQLLDVTGRLQAKISLRNNSYIDLSGYHLASGLYQVLLVRDDKLQPAGRVLITH